MARPLRIDDPDGWHHVMNRGLDHQPIFFHHRDRVSGRFHSVPVQSETQIARTAAYIHRNPIDFVPQAALETYRWSSYGPYLGRRETPPWLSRSMVDELLTLALHRELVSLPLESPGQTRVTTETIHRIVGARLDLSCPEGKRLRLLLGFEVAELTAPEVAHWLGLASAGAARTALTRARAARRNVTNFDALVVELESRVRAAA